jgi:hypothetical protein
MYKLEFKLKQHTPLIHFQHDQHGATLRASEVKPKLDRFIIEKYGLDKIKKYFIGDGEHKALDYKVKITTSDIKLKEIRKGENIPMFFGNMGNDYTKAPKAFSSTESPVILQFLVFNPKLLKIIEADFPFFLARTNFGTRQNKGFGSFFPDVNLNAASNYFKGIPYLEIRNNSISGYNDIFYIINYYYQRLKSGINYNRIKHYKHSFLKLYLSETKLGYEWEKRWLKEKFIGLPPNKEEEKFARAMLGLTGSYSFLPSKNPRPNEVYPERKLEIEVSDPREEIFRFQSPITFKPIKDNFQTRIYIFTDTIPKYIQEKGFYFADKNKAATLKTPNKVINTADLIKKYHAHLGRSFRAYTFNGTEYKVDIK